MKNIIYRPEDTLSINLGVIHPSNSFYIIHYSIKYGSDRIHVCTTIMSDPGVTSSEASKTLISTLKNTDAKNADNIKVEGIKEITEEQYNRYVTLTRI